MPRPVAERLAELARVAGASVTMSIGFRDDELAAKIEPWASPPSRRLRATRVLADAGVPVGVSISPVIPGLNDEQIPALLEATAAAGARSAFLILGLAGADGAPVPRGSSFRRPRAQRELFE